MILFNIDGIDGVGKSTIIDRVSDFLSFVGITTMIIHFPRYNTEIGKRIHEVLVGNINCDGVALQTLYTADRILFCTDDLDYLNYTDVLLIDRYYTSGYVYGLLEGLSAKQIDLMHTGMIKPKKHFIITAPIEEVIHRLKKRDNLERYDNIEKLKTVNGLYKGLPALLPKDKFQTINNFEGKLEDSVNTIVHEILKIFREGK